MSNENALQQRELTLGERFAEKVLAEFRVSSGGELAVNDFQRRLIQNYFISVDAALKTAEENRKKKPEKYRDRVPVSWANVDMEKLAFSVKNTAQVGLDPSLKNHLSFIPFKNNSTGKYDIGFIRGYVGLEIVAKKYGLEVPVDVITELVYSTDVFKPIKRGPWQAYESYEHEITQPFDRGSIVGGFIYYIYSEPTKNKLIIMTLKDILKRKPKNASAEFWGGEKDKWENGQKVGKEHVEGWFEEMCLKTLKRKAYDSIPIDPEKVDAAYIGMKQTEKEFSDAEVINEISENANTERIDIEATEERVVVEAEYTEADTTPVQPAQEAQAPQEAQPKRGPAF